MTPTIRNRDVIIIRLVRCIIKEGNNSQIYNSNNNIEEFYSKTKKEPSLSSTYKKAIIDWMVHLAILKEQTVNIHDLPKYCDNGILTADIINRLEGVIFK